MLQTNSENSRFSVLKAIIDSYMVGIFFGIIIICTVGALIAFISSGFDLHAVVSILFIPLVWILACYHLAPGLVIAICLATLWRSYTNSSHSRTYQLSTRASVLLWVFLMTVSVFATYFFPAIFVRSNLLWNVPIAAVCLGISIFAFRKSIARQIDRPAVPALDLVSDQVRVKSMKNW